MEVSCLNASAQPFRQVCWVLASMLKLPPRPDAHDVEFSFLLPSFSRRLLPAGMLSHVLSHSLFNRKEAVLGLFREFPCTPPITFLNFGLVKPRSRRSAPWPLPSAILRISITWKCQRMRNPWVFTGTQQSPKLRMFGGMFLDDGHQ